MFEDIINDNIEVFDNGEVIIEINWTKKTVKVKPGPGVTAENVYKWFSDVHKKLGDRSPFKKISKKGLIAVVKTDESWSILLNVKGTSLYIDEFILNDIKIKECTFTNMEVTF